MRIRWFCERRYPTLAIQKDVLFLMGRDSSFSLVTTFGQMTFSRICQEAATAEAILVHADRLDETLLRACLHVGYRVFTCKYHGQILETLVEWRLNGDVLEQVDLIAQASNPGRNPRFYF